MSAPGEGAPGSRSRYLSFLDTETTGLSPRQNVIVEVAVVRTTPDLRVVEEYQALVNPDSYGSPYDIDPAAMAVNGLSLERLRAEGRPAGEVARELAARLAGTRIVAHSVVLDFEMVRGMFERTGVPLPETSYEKICTKSMAWPLVASGAVRDAKLTTLSEALGLPYPTQHRALADARQALELYRVLSAGMRLAPERMRSRGAALGR